MNGNVQDAENVQDVRDAENVRHKEGADIIDDAHGPEDAKRRRVMLWLRIARVYGRLSHVANKHIRENGLTPAQFDVIVQAGSAPGLTQEQLAKRLLVTQGNITQLLGRMEKAGLVKRERDARCNRVMLTPKGKRFYDDIVPAHEQWMATQFDELTNAERLQLAALLRKLDRTLQSENG